MSEFRMAIEPLSLQTNYWMNFKVTNEDLEFLYNYLLEIETPQTPEELTKALVNERIRMEKEMLESKRSQKGTVYYPKDHYFVGQNLQFPVLGWQTGTVINIRAANNPELATFEVIDVELESGITRQFAAGFLDHQLNQPVTVASSDPLLDVDYVLKQYEDELVATVSEELQSNPGLVRIAGKWFPRALLVDINVGHLNLAEAVLDMIGGGPLPTSKLMEQIDLPFDDGSNLNEFSLNLALQEDKRFDEVGPSGEVLWFLHRLEPEPVRETPIFLRYSNKQVDSDLVQEAMREFDAQVIDELLPDFYSATEKSLTSCSISLIYPHWRSGTLPLAGALNDLFPTAIESPRIQFTFVDGNSGEKFSGWVVRPKRYVYGLRDWFLSQGLIPGSLVHIERGKKPGEIIIKAEKKRGSREWIRTVIIGSDGGVVFSMLKQNINAAIDERMAVMVPDVEMLDSVWDRILKSRQSLPQTVRQIMGELAKLSPQSHVHAQELYAGVNILRRCPPDMVLDILINNEWANHLGNLYFRLDERAGGNDE